MREVNYLRTVVAAATSRAKRVSAPPGKFREPARHSQCNPAGLWERFEVSTTRKGPLQPQSQVTRRIQRLSCDSYLLYGQSGGSVSAIRIRSRKNVRAETGTSGQLAVQNGMTQRLSSEHISCQDLNYLTLDCSMPRQESSLGFDWRWSFARKE